MTIRIAQPEGNDARGGKLYSLKPDLKALIDEWNRLTTERLLGLARRRPYRRPPRHRKTGRFDTIVCPAHQDSFEKVFLGEHCWYAIRISKKVIPRLKYIAMYVTGRVRKVSHYGRIRSIRPWKNSGKYVVNLKGAPREIGPVRWVPGVVIQSPRFAAFSRLRKASTLAAAL